MSAANCSTERYRRSGSLRRAWARMLWRSPWIWPGGIQTAEETQFHDSGVPRIVGRHLLHGAIDVQHIGTGSYTYRRQPRRGSQAGIALGRLPFARVVDEHTPHHLGSYRDEMTAALPIHLLNRTDTQMKLMNEGALPSGRRSRPYSSGHSHRLRLIGRRKVLHPGSRGPGSHIWRNICPGCLERTSLYYERV